MASVSTQYKYLERDPLSSYKQLSIKGRRIKARTLYGAYMSEEEPRTVEEIAKDYDLPIEVVKEAIAYCESDPPEIREDYAREQAVIQASAIKDLSPQEVARIRREVEERFSQETKAREG